MQTPNSIENNEINDIEKEVKTKRKYVRKQPAPQVIDGYTHDDLKDIGLAFVKRVTKEKEIELDNETHEQPQPQQPQQPKKKRVVSEKQMENFEKMMTAKQQINDQKRKQKELEIELKKKLKEEKTELKKLLDLKNLATSVRIEKLQQSITDLQAKKEIVEKHTAESVKKIVEKPKVKLERPQVDNNREPSVIKKTPVNRHQLMAHLGF
jgi:hypothetical protein